MREIKFRAWHKKHLRMFQLSAVDFATKWAGCRTEQATINLCVQCENKPCYAPFFHLADLELMQYTGLKDKNGKEIYEGDIVHNILTDESHPIRFYAGSFCTIIGGVTCPMPLWELKSFEVIGNIYENTELWR